MIYYSLTICFILSIFGTETKQFVEFKQAEVQIVQEKGYATITLPFKVLTDYHIQSNADNSDGSIATEITFKENDSYKVEHQEFSLNKDETIFLNGYAHKVIPNQFEVKIVLKLKENTPNTSLDGVLNYQACTDRQCLFPRALNFQIPL